MKLLTNDQTERGWINVGNFYIPADYTINAAVFGPYRNGFNVRRALAIVYLAAIVIVCLDLFVWRAA